MQAIYSIAIGFYYLGLRIASLWNLKAQKMVQGRRNSRYAWDKIDKENPTIWFHCASVGEFEQALPLIQLFKKSRPKAQLVTTFFSPSGYEYATEKYPDDLFFYLPFDFKRSQRDFLKIVNPQLVFIVKYEFWFNLLDLLWQKKIPTYLISGIFRDNQLFFSSYTSFFRRHLSCFKHFFVQDEKSIQLLQQIGYKNATLSGDTRFDRVIENSMNKFEDTTIQQFVIDSNVLVAGSVWKEDMGVLNLMIQKLPPTWKIIIVPHELDHFEPNWIEETSFKYSDKTVSIARIMILNRMGMLSKLYRFATFAYVGGGFGKSIHNILEAAVYKIPVTFGPKWQKFHEAKSLLELGCAFDVTGPKFRTDYLPKLIEKGELYTNIALKLNAYFEQNSNVAEKIYVHLIQE